MAAVLAPRGRSARIGKRLALPGSAPITTQPVPMTRQDQRARKWRTYGDTVLEFAAGPVVDLREPLHPSTVQALAEAGLAAPFAVLTADMLEETAVTLPDRANDTSTTP